MASDQHSTIGYRVPLRSPSETSFRQVVRVYRIHQRGDLRTEVSVVDPSLT
jgi:hypothetical protein